MQPELKKALENIEILKNLIQTKFKDEKRRTALLRMVDDLGEDYVIAPASTRTQYHGAYPGGLVEAGLKTVKLMGAMNKLYESDLSTDSIIVTGLFYDLGKTSIGDKPYFLPKNSDWHTKQGIIYEVNPEVVDLPVFVRSLFILQSAGVTLTEDECYAIASIKDRSRYGDANTAIPNESFLALALQHSSRVVARKGAWRTSLVQTNQPG